MKNKLKLFLTNEFIQGGVFMTISSFVVNFINYFFHFLAGRSLGPSGYGEIITLFSYLYIVSVPTTVISTVIIQKISAKASPHQIDYVYSLESFFWRLIKKWWILLIFLIMIIPFISKITNLAPVISGAFIPLVVLGFITVFYHSAIQGLRMFLIFSLISISTALLKVLGPVFTSFGIDGLSTIVIFLIISSLTTFFISYLILFKRRPAKTPKNIDKELKHILADSQFIMTFVSVLALIAFNNLDIIFVKKFFSPQEAGIYGAWSLFAKIILYLVGSLIPVSFVFFSSQQNKKNQDKAFLFSIILFIIIGLISYIGYKTWALLIVNMLFGIKFAALTSYLSLAGIFGSFYAFITFANNYFLAKKSLFSLILFFFIPFYLLFLFLIPQKIISIIMLNIIFSFIVVVFYLSAFLFSIISPKWKQNKPVIS